MFDRVTQALAGSTPERFYILYGSGVEDVFINDNGTELNIEQALFAELKAQRYERIVYSAPHRPVFFSTSIPLLVPCHLLSQHPIRG